MPSIRQLVQRMRRDTDGIDNAILFNREMYVTARLVPWGNIAHAFVVILIAAAVYPADQHRTLWIGGGVMLSAWIFIVTVPATKAPQLANPHAIRRHLIAVDVFGGAYWTLAQVACFPHITDAQTALLTSCIAGLMGGGAIAMSTSRSVAMLWVLFVGLGPALMTGLQPGLMMKLLALGAVFYVLYLCVGIEFLSSSFRARCKAELTAEREREKVALLLNEFEGGSRDWIWETREDGTFSHVSARFAEATVLPAETLQTLTLPQLLMRLGIATQPGGEAVHRHLSNALNVHLAFADVTVPLTVAGEHRWWSLSGQQKAGAEPGWRGIGTDVTTAKVAQDQIDRMATTDALTGLANRYSLNRELDARLTQLRANGAAHVAMIDLDNFKSVNDTLGHLFGDELLASVANRLAEALTPGEFSARLGGDEFAVILEPDLPDAQALSRCTALQSHLLSSAFTLNGNLVELTCSVGVASTRDLDVVSAQTLLSAADMALYGAKDTGRNRTTVYTPALGEQAVARSQSIQALAAGLTNREFEVYYQPQIDIAEGEVIGFEALVRWNHPTLGLLQPKDFIDVAEGTGLIVPLGLEVLRMACDEAARWPESQCVSVNVSPRQLLSAGFIHRVAEELRRSGLPASRLKLEITETVLIEPAAQQTISALQTSGIAISIDDFGTGYSSLHQLQNTPVDEIKIDRSFVEPLKVNDATATLIVETVISLAQALGLRVIAEGVETIEQRDHLQALGCDLYQGFFEAEPMSSVDVDVYLARRPLRSSL